MQVGDLGVSKLLKDGLACTQVGTPYNMSPELWGQKPYAQSTDLWALGCMLYELITLRCVPLLCTLPAMLHAVRPTTTTLECAHCGATSNQAEAHAGSPSRRRLFRS